MLLCQLPPTRLKEPPKKHQINKIRAWHRPCLPIFARTLSQRFTPWRLPKFCEGVGVARHDPPVHARHRRAVEQRTNQRLHWLWPYCRFHLHIGNLVQIMSLNALSALRPQTICLGGWCYRNGGRPFGKSAERNLLSEDVLRHNQTYVKAQAGKVFDFSTGSNQAEMVNNYDWFKDIRFLDFIRDVGKHITINCMMGKDSVQNRLEAGMSFTEFTYQLVQASILLAVPKQNYKLQMGGSDQWAILLPGTGTDQAQSQWVKHTRSLRHLLKSRWHQIW